MMLPQTVTSTVKNDTKLKSTTCTVPAFNSCNKMRGQPGHNTRLYAQLPPSFLGMDALDDITT